MRLAPGRRQHCGDRCPRERLSLLAYDCQDLQRLAHLRHLRTLRMKERPALRTLEGVQRLSWLDTLEIYMAPLHDITALAEARSPVLRALALGGCKQVTELDTVAACEALEELDVSEFGAMSSLSPIAGLDRLSRLYLYGSTRVVDGDLTPLSDCTGCATCAWRAAPTTRRASPR